MYRRRLVFNKGSYYVSIPKEIVEIWGLKRGDELILEYSRDELKIRKTDPFKSALDLLKDGKNKVYTIGYEGKKIDEFLEELSSNKIKRVIDVREIPLSRKNGFSKKSLHNILKKVGIEYMPLKNLGSPKELRQELRSKSLTFSQFANLYRDYLLEHSEDIQILEIYASTKTSAIMCFEADWKKCHRSILAEFLERKGFEVIHI